MGRVAGMTIFYGLGVAGASFILLGFLLRRHKKYGVGSLFYAIVNFVGSVALVIYAWEGSVWPFVALNAIWVGDSLLDIVKVCRKRS